MSNLRNGIKHPQQISMLIGENELLKGRVSKVPKKTLSEEIKAVRESTGCSMGEAVHFVKAFKIMRALEIEEIHSLHDADVIKHYLTGQLKSRQLTDELRDNLKEGDK